MELGWCDFCIRVEQVRASREFYEKFGLKTVEGDDNEGWAVQTDGAARIGLYEKRHLGDQPFLINFRGGDVKANVEALRAKGLEPSKGPAYSAQGSSAHYKDPGGHEIFLDTMHGELKQG